jgi:uncharacterized protein YjiS (DUF1127 family)
MKSSPTSALTDDRVPALPARRSRARRMTGPGLLRLIGWWIERSRQRRALSELDDERLDDIGVTRTEAEREFAKPFWR